MELLQSPWLMELDVFCLNFKGFKDGNYPSEFSTHFSFNVDAAPTMTLMLLNSIKLEYDLTCPICLEFDLYALDWWTSLLKIMCLFSCFSDDLRWTKGY